MNKIDEIVGREMLLFGDNSPSYSKDELRALLQEAVEECCAKPIWCGSLDDWWNQATDEQKKTAYGQCIDADCWKASRIRELEADCLTLAMRLYGEPDESMAQETLEVMRRWRPVVDETFESPAIAAAEGK